jgi:hypothetical protein
MGLLAAPMYLFCAGGVMTSTSLFRGGFADFRRTGAFSDICLVVDGRRYRAHRLVLAFSSDFFSTMLAGDFRERYQEEIELKFPDPKNAFQDVLNFIYGLKLEILAHNVLPIMAQAEQYLIKPLVQRCRDFISKHLNRRTVFSLLLDAIQFGQADVIDQCVKLVASNFLHLIDHDFSDVDPEVLIQLLHHQRLVCRRSISLFRRIASLSLAG